MTTTPHRRVAAIVLAAGGGSRFDGPTHKLLAPLRGRPMVVWAVEAAVDARGATATDLGPIFVVTGAVDLTDVLDDAGLLDHVTLVPNEHWRDGQATSLAAGIAAARGADPDLDAVVVGLGDQPRIPPEAWRRVAAAELDRPIAVATYDGNRRNPVRLDRSVWSELPDHGDEGARTLMSRRPELVGEVGCPGEPADVDTLEDLARWS